MNYYHYTDINGLKGILENKEIWLTDIRFLNDESEGDELLRCMRRYTPSDSGNKKKFLAFIKPSKDFQCFVASFCRKKDLLSQWRGYCPKTGGYSIGFKNDYSGCLVAKWDGHEEQYEYSKEYFSECIYDEDKKKKSVIESYEKYNRWMGHNSEVGRFISGKIFKNNIINKLFVFKDMGFSEEDEFRFVVIVSSSGFLKTFHRNRSSISIPFIKMKFETKFIDEIVIGPTRNKGLAKDSLYAFLNDLGPDYAHIKISQSKIPYRPL